MDLEGTTQNRHGRASGDTSALGGGADSVRGCSMIVARAGAMRRLTAPSAAMIPMSMIRLRLNRLACGILQQILMTIFSHF